MKKNDGEKAVLPRQYDGGKAYDWESLDSLEKKNAKKPPLVVGIRGKMDLNKMKQKQVLLHKSLKKQDNDFLDHIVNHCYFDELMGQFRCKKCNCVVHVDWSRTYGFCAVHDIL